MYVCVCVCVSSTICACRNVKIRTVNISFEVDPGILLCLQGPVESGRCEVAMGRRNPGRGQTTKAERGLFPLGPEKRQCGFRV